MSFVCKTVKLLDWCTELPKDCPQKSPVFLLNGTECFFRFTLKKYNVWYYYLYLEIKSKLTKSENCRLQVGFKKEKDLSLCKKTFMVSEGGCNRIWCAYMKEIESKLPSDYMFDNCIKIRFSFEDMCEHPLKDKNLKVVKDVDEKAVQISSYKDVYFSMKSLSHDFSKLLDEGPHHDVEFICGDQIIKAHKSVLACRSEVFASMLQSDMVEGKTGCVTLQDMDPTFFQEFLKCLYTGLLPELTSESAYQFYEVADKYCIDAVKKQCSDFLTDNLSPENVCDILALSDRHNDVDFKKAVMEYIVKEKIPYVGQKWTDFCSDNPILANEALNVFCQHLRPK